MSKVMEMLKERIEDNYEDFKALMLSLDAETIFDSARRIAATTDVVFYLNNYNLVDDEAAAYLLDFSEPLKLLADVWEEMLEDGECDFSEAIEMVLDSDSNEENYMTLAMEGKLRHKYGEDADITSALVAEIVEAGSRYLELQELLLRMEGM